MKKPFGTMILGCITLGLLAVTAGCAAPASQRPLEAVEAAVSDVPAGLDEVRVDEGKDGLSRHVLLHLVASGDELPAESVTATLQAVGGALPEAYDSVHVAASTASGERLDVDVVLESIGFSETFMVNPRMAYIPASAIRSFAGER
ncbi:hypothetical protein [Agromyces allii]|uniref:Uncharacterized protein n=1 Tax=Agromyces allii TaxID=393607 RepID=A0ABP5BG89_9MICO|nr:hypothetical protein [Agromyces allii]